VPRSILVDNSIKTLTDEFVFVPACTAASAYLLLAFLILLTKDIKPIDRLQMFVYGGLALLAFNIIRIEVLLWFFFRQNAMFETVHLFIWKFMATAFVALLWVALAKIYRVKSVPVYSDIAYLVKEIRRG